MPPAFETPAQRADTPAQLCRRLVARLLFKVTQQERQAEVFRQAIEFLVEQPAHFTPGHFRRRVGTGHVEQGFVAWPPRSRTPEFAGDPTGDAVEPAAQRLPFANRAGPARQ